MAKCDGERMPDGCSARFERIAEDLGEIKGLARQAAENSARTNGHVTRLYDRLGEHATRLAVIEARPAPGGAEGAADRSAVREALAGVVKCLPYILSALAAAVAVIAYMAKHAAAVAGCAAAAALLTLGGCRQGGFIRAAFPDGTTVSIRQPAGATEPATFAWTQAPRTAGGQGSAAASTGAPGPLSPAAIAAGQTWIAWIVGPAIAVVGVGCLVARRWIPLIPTTAGTYLIAAGAGVVAAAIALPAVPRWVWTAGALAALALGAWLIVPGVLANRRAAAAAATT